MRSEFAVTADFRGLWSLGEHVTDVSPATVEPGIPKILRWPEGVPRRRKSRNDDVTHQNLTTQNSRTNASDCTRVARQRACWVAFASNFHAVMISRTVRSYEYRIIRTGTAVLATTVQLSIHGRIPTRYTVRAVLELASRINEWYRRLYRTYGTVTSQVRP